VRACRDQRLTQSNSLTVRETITVEDIFRERCDARAILYAASVFDLHTAVDVLQTDAKRPGLIDQIGQNRVQEIMAAAFHAVRGIQQQPFLVKQFSKTVEKNSSIAKSVLPISTVRAAEFLIQQNDPKRLHAWLAKHTRAERAAIRCHFEQKEKQK
jgi:hypothetical protein